MFKIGVFSRLTMVSVRMLRYYDEVGLFKPLFVDDFTSYRYYSASQIKKLNLIISLRDLGFSVSDIALIIDEDSKKTHRMMLENKRAETKEKIEKDRNILAKINSAIENFDKEKISMKYNVSIKSIPFYKDALRKIIPTYNDEGMLWSRICELIEEKNVKYGKVSFTVFHDEGHKDNDVDVEVMHEVKELMEGDGEYEFKQTEPINKAACVLVPGDYKNIGPAFNFIGEWIEKNGYCICGNARQSCIKGPWCEENPDDYLTELQISVYKP